MRGASRPGKRGEAAGRREASAQLNIERMVYQALLGRAEKAFPLCDVPKAHAPLYVGRARVDKRGGKPSPVDGVTGNGAQALRHDTHDVDTRKAWLYCLCDAGTNTVKPIPFSLFKPLSGAALNTPDPTPGAA